MSLSPPELSRLAVELSRLAGARVQKLSVTGPHTVYVEVREPGASRVLLFETSAGLARAGIVGERAASPERPLAFQGLLRAHLGGARLDRVETEPASLLLRVTFATDRGEHTLVQEVDGRGGLVALLDRRDSVLGATPSEKARERGLIRGQTYIPPPVREAVTQTDRFPPVEGEPFGVSAAIEQHYGVVSREKAARDVRSTLLPALRAARKRAARTIEKIRADLSRVDGAAQYQRYGDVLKPQLHTLHRGATEARGTEYGEEGPREVVVPLLPHLSPRENLERYYHLHKRLVRSADRVLERLVGLEEQHERLAALVTRAEAATDEATLAGIEDDARRDRLLREDAGSRTPRTADAPRLPYREFHSATGQRIWVGRNARDNDALTFRHARGNDLWLHARGLTGSHVIVPGVGAEGPDGETLLDAATLAAHYSAGREELVVDVASTRRKYVHKPRGAAAGAVQITQERTIQLRMEAARLERLLASGG